MSNEIATICFERDKHGLVTVMKHSKYAKEVAFCPFVSGKLKCRPSCPYMRQHPMAKEDGPIYGNPGTDFDRIVICDLMTRKNGDHVIIYTAIGISEKELPDFLVESLPPFE